MSKIGFSLGYRLMWAFLAMSLMCSAFWAGVSAASGGVSPGLLLFIILGGVVLILTLVAAGRKSP